MKGSRPHIAAALQKRIDKLPHIEKNGLRIVEKFGFFVDTHRDQPHVGSFHDDIHRGHCIPMVVDYVIGDDYLRNPEDGSLIDRHEKHLFITDEQWGKFLLDALMTTGDPRDGQGSLPTSHFRDARKGVYLLKSFRQMVAEVEKRA
jgi:hypothetical protein